MNSLLLATAITAAVTGPMTYPESGIPPYLISLPTPQSNTMDMDMDDLYTFHDSQLANATKICEAINSGVKYILFHLRMQGGKTGSYLKASLDLLYNKKQKHIPANKKANKKETNLFFIR